MSSEEFKQYNEQSPRRQRQKSPDVKSFLSIKLPLSTGTSPMNVPIKEERKRPLTPRRLITKMSTSNDNSNTTLTIQQTAQISQQQELSQKSNDELLNYYFFEEDSKLLNVYCQTFIKGGEINQYHIKVLLKYFRSHGKMNKLLTTLAINEIENANRSNELFRGNTIFTRVYLEYLKNYCNDYLSSIVHKIETIMNKHQIRQSISLIPTKQMSEKQFEKMYKEILIFLSHEFKNIHNIPQHLRYIIKQIYIKVVQVRDEKSAKNVLETLLFLRFILPPLSSNPELLKKIQILLKKANGKLSTINTINGEELKKLQPWEIQFISSVNYFYHSFIQIPLNLASVSKGIDRKLQDETFKEIVEIMRSQLSVISRNYGEGFENVMKILKRSKETTKGDIYGASDMLSNWMKEKQNEMEEENRLLRIAIADLKKSCDELRERIKLLQK